MTWIATILLAPVALALVVIALPFDARAQGGVADGELSGAVRIRWAFGLAGVELRAGASALWLAGVRVLRIRPGRRGRRERRAELEKKASKGPGARLRAGLGHRGPLARMVGRLGRTLHLRLRVRGRVGTDDPADTAAVAGLIQAAQAVPGVEVEVAVDWLDEVLELEAEGSARVWVPEVLAVAGWLFLRRGNRAAVRALAS